MEGIISTVSCEKNATEDGKFLFKSGSDDPVNLVRGFCSKLNMLDIFSYC